LKSLGPVIKAERSHVGFVIAAGCEKKVFLRLELKEVDVF